MLDLIIKYLLIVLLIVQIYTLLDLIYSSYKRRKEDKAFWEKIHKEIDHSVELYQETLNGCDKMEEITDGEEDKGL